MGKVTAVKIVSATNISVDQDVVAEGEQFTKTTTIVSEDGKMLTLKSEGGEIKLYRVQ